MIRALRYPLLALALLAAGATAAAAQPGALDPSFGKGGIVSVRFSGFITINQTLIQSDNKIIAVATGTPTGETDRRSTLAILRVLPNGAPDPSFGANGTATLKLANYSLEAANALLQTDGKLLVCGYAADFPVQSRDDNPSKLLLVRFMPDGTLDTGFGTAGTVLLSVFGQINSIATAILQQSDAKIVLAGQTSGFEQTTYDIVLRLAADGTLDTSFGQAGIFSIAPPHSDIGTDLPVAAALQSDGKIIVGSLQTEAPKPALAFRVTSAGTLDSTHAPGQVTANPQASSLRYTGFAFQPDGDYVLANTVIVRHQGTGYARPAPERFTLASHLDTSFARTRIDYANQPHQNASDAAYALLVQPDGKILAGGGRSVFDKSGMSHTQFGLARETSSGIPDTSFGSDGAVTTKIAGFIPRIFVLALQADGNIVAAGDTNDKTLLLARYLGQ